MIQKGFLNRNNNRDSKNTRQFAFASNLMLYFGVVILIAALIYMISNFAKADMIISICLPFLIAGVFMIFMSLLIKWKTVRIKH